MKENLPASFNRMRLNRTLIIGFVSWFNLSGCSQNLLYDANRDKMGQTAVKAASEVKLSDTVSAFEHRFAGLLALEVEAVKTRMAHIRELEIRQLAFESKSLENTWSKRLDKRISELAGDPKDWKEYSGLRAKMKSDQTRLDDSQQAFQEAVSLTVPACEEIMKAGGLPQTIAVKVPEESRSEAARLAKRLQETCTNYNHSVKAVERFEGNWGGKIGEAGNQSKADLAEKQKNDETRKKAQSELKAAMDAYALESKSLGTADDRSAYTSRLMAAAEKLREAIKRLESAQEVLGSEIVAEERIKQIETVLSALAGGETDPSKWSDDLRKAVAVAGSLPSLADDAVKALRESKQPRLIPLAIAREHQRLLVDEAAKVAKIQSRRIAASEELVETYLIELDTLVDIRQKLNDQEGWSSQSLLQLNKELKPDKKRLLYELLGTYFDEIPRLQSEERALEYARLSTFYDETQARSKSAALMWQNSFDGIANTLAAYHSTGIKPEELARLIQALGITAIGVGANR